MKLPILIIVAAVLCTGCKSAPQPEPNLQVGNDFARIDQSAKTIGDNLTLLKPFVMAGGAPLTQAIWNGLSDIHSGVASGAQSSVAEATDKARIQGNADALQRKYDAQYNSWWAWLGRMIWRAFWIIIGLYVAGGIFACFFMGQTGLLGRAATFLLHLLPAMNIFSIPTAIAKGWIGIKTSPVVPAPIQTLTPAAPTV